MHSCCPSYWTTAHRWRRIPHQHARLTEGSKTQITGRVTTNCCVDGVYQQLELNYVPDMAHQVILGSDTMINFHMVISIRTGTITCTPPTITSLSTSATSDITPEMRPLSKSETLQGYRNLEKPKFSRIKGVTRLVKHHIIKQRYLPRNPKMLDTLNSEVDSMLPRPL